MGGVVMGKSGSVGLLALREGRLTECSSHLTFSLDPGWTFVDMEDWCPDLSANWIREIGGDPGELPSAILCYSVPFIILFFVLVVGWVYKMMHGISELFGCD
jgi:hypothetical protein